MLTWEDWFIYLHGMMDPRESHAVAEIRHYHALIELCRAQMSFSRYDLRVRALDELWQMGLLLIDQEPRKAEQHRRQAAELNGCWQRFFRRPESSLTVATA